MLLTNITGNDSNQKPLAKPLGQLLEKLPGIETLSFKARLFLFFVQNYHFACTKKACEHPRIREKICERKLTGGAELGRFVREGIARKEMKLMIGEGQAQELLQNGFLTSHVKNYWSDSENRIFWMRKMVASLGKDLMDISCNDLLQNGLAALTHKYPVHQLISEAFPEKNIQPWEMTFCPKNYFNKKKNRVKAIEWLVFKLGKDPNDYTAEEREVFELRKTKIYDMCTSDWEAYFKLRKDPRDLQVGDFKKCGLLSLLRTYYSYSPYKAASEAFPYVKPWEMHKNSNALFTNNEKLQEEAVIWLSKKIVVHPQNLLPRHFLKNKLSWLVDSRNGRKLWINAILRACPHLKAEDLLFFKEKNMKNENF